MSVSDRQGCDPTARANHGTTEVNHLSTAGFDERGQLSSCILVARGDSRAFKMNSNRLILDSQEDESASLESFWFCE